MSETVDISSLIPDKKNANRGTKRGREALKKSLQTSKAGRSILLDKNGQIIAGNKTAEAAESAGISEVVIVHTTGNQLVAVMRDDLDLDDPHGQARRLAYEDNFIGQVSLDFDPEILRSDLDAGLDLSGMWEAEELERLLYPDGIMPSEQEAEEVEAPDDFGSYDESIETAYCCPKCGYEWSGKPK